MTSAGNIPVDRKSHDRQKLFLGSFKALSAGAAVALFPEGTSYTETRIMQVKDGAAWAALEYTKWAKEKGLTKHEKVKIVPAAIVYTDKSKYRSQVSIAVPTCSAALILLSIGYHGVSRILPLFVRQALTRQRR